MCITTYRTREKTQQCIHVNASAWPALFIGLGVYALVLDWGSWNSKLLLVLGFGISACRLFGGLSVFRRIQGQRGQSMFECFELRDQRLQTRFASVEFVEDWRGH